MSTTGTPTRGTRYRAVAASVLAVVVALALSGCGAGLGANTAQPYDASLGSDAVMGNIHVNDVVVVTDGNIPELEAVLVNQGRIPDTLQSMQVTGVTSVALPQGGVDVPPTGFVVVGPDGTQRVLMSDLQVGLGQLVQVTFFFQVAGRVSLSAIVTTPGNLRAGS
jgi:hypothetical protein